MMSPKRLLRTFILIQIPIGFLLGAAGFLLNRNASPEIQSLLAYKDSIRPGAMPLGIAVLIALLVANVGLYLFWRPARTLYLVATIGALLASLYLGPFVNPGPADFLETALDAVGGIILGLVYFSPVKEAFEQRVAAVSFPSQGFATPMPPVEPAANGYVFSGNPAPLREEIAARSVPPSTVVTAPAAAEVTVKCANCGALSTGKKFCEECGAPFASKVRCPHCGSEVAPGKKFCGDCGGAVR
jgi:double zinc ribbon protein